MGKRDSRIKIEQRERLNGFRYKIRSITDFNLERVRSTPPLTESAFTFEKNSASRCIPLRGTSRMLFSRILLRHLVSRAFAICIIVCGSKVFRLSRRYVYQLIERLSPTSSNLDQAELAK